MDSVDIIDDNKIQNMDDMNDMNDMITFFTPRKHEHVTNTYDPVDMDTNHLPRYASRINAPPKVDPIPSMIYDTVDEAWKRYAIVMASEEINETSLLSEEGRASSRQRHAARKKDKVHREFCMQGVESGDSVEIRQGDSVAVRVNEGACVLGRVEAMCCSDGLQPCFTVRPYATPYSLREKEWPWSGLVDHSHELALTDGLEVDDAKFNVDDIDRKIEVQTMRDFKQSRRLQEDSVSDGGVYIVRGVFSENMKPHMEYTESLIELKDLEDSLRNQEGSDDEYDPIEEEHREKMEEKKRKMRMRNRARKRRCTYTDIAQTEVGKFERVGHHSLMLNHVRPHMVICRDVQWSKLTSFLDYTRAHDQGGHMNITGRPGTGKTSTLKASIHKAFDLKNVSYTCSEVNGMKIKDPYMAFSILCENITGMWVPDKDEAQRSLDDVFFAEKKSRRSKKVVRHIIVIEEIDAFTIGRPLKDVLYAMSEWTQKHCGLILFTVSNDMNFNQKLTKKCTSRMWLNEITFPAYTATDLINIVKDRLDPGKAALARVNDVARAAGDAREAGGSVDVQGESAGASGSRADEIAGDAIRTSTVKFEERAIELAAKKVAAVYGDARRVLELCRRSLEIAETVGVAKVTTEIVWRAHRELFSSSNHLYEINSFKDLVFLVAVVHECSKGHDQQYVQFHGVSTRFEEYVQPEPKRRQIADTLIRLVANGSLKCDSRMSLLDRFTEISLGNCVTEEMITKALKCHPLESESVTNAGRSALTHFLKKWS